MKHPFQAYESAYWHHHVSKYANADEELSSLLDLFLKPGSHAFLPWLEIISKDSRPWKVSPLHIAASKNLARMRITLIPPGQILIVSIQTAERPLHRENPLRYER